MKLYHFTSDRHIASCRMEGLTKGITPILVKGRLIDYRKGTQWLTTNPVHDQTWNQGSTLPYCRTDNKITVEIPKEYECNVVPWDIYSKSLPQETVQLLNLFGDPENWRIYIGKVHPEWFILVERNGESE